MASFNLKVTSKEEMKAYCMRMLNFPQEFHTVAYFFLNKTSVLFFSSVTLGRGAADEHMAAFTAATACLSVFFNLCRITE